MKFIFLLIFPSMVQAATPQWAVQENSTTGKGTAVLSGQMKVYGSTQAAATAPTIVLQGNGGKITARDGANVSTMSPTGFAGNLTGNVTGNLTGNVTGISAGTTLLGGATSYLPYSSNLPGGSTSYIQISTTATGGTFHASSGTVDGTMTATGGFTGTASNASNLEGTDLGTLTDTKYCTYDLAGTEIDCNADVSGMTPGATYYLGIGDTLQAGSTVYASSGSFHNTAFLGRNTITSGVGAVFGYPATWTDDQSANAPVAWEVRRGPGVPGAWLDWYSGWTSPSLKIGQGSVGNSASLVVTGNQTTGFNGIFTGNAGAMDYTASDPNWRIGFCSNYASGGSCTNNGQLKGGYAGVYSGGGWRLGWDAINSSGEYYQWLAVKTNTSATAEVGIDAKLCVGCGSLTTPVSSKFDVLNGSITVRGTGTGLRVQSLASCGTIGTDAQGSMTCGTGGFSELSSTQTFTGQNTFSNLVTFSSDTVGVWKVPVSSQIWSEATCGVAWFDVDLSPWVGARATLAYLRFKQTSNNAGSMWARPKGESDPGQVNYLTGPNSASNAGLNYYNTLLVTTNSDGVFQMFCGVSSTFNAWIAGAIR